MSRRGTWLLERLRFQYCDWQGASRGLRCAAQRSGAAPADRVCMASDVAPGAVAPAALPTRLRPHACMTLPPDSHPHPPTGAGLQGVCGAAAARLQGRQPPDPGRRGRQAQPLPLHRGPVQDAQAHGCVGGARHGRRQPRCLHAWAARRGGAAAASGGCGCAIDRRCPPPGDGQQAAQGTAGHPMPGHESSTPAAHTWRRRAGVPVRGRARTAAPSAGLAVGLGLRTQQPSAPPPAPQALSRARWASST